MEITADNLRTRSCSPSESGALPLDGDDIRPFMDALPGWRQEGAEIVKVFSFKNYYQTVSFVNAVAWIANREDHHPEVSFDYKTCTVRYSTHSVGGLSENDFICAAKIDNLVD